MDSNSMTPSKNVSSPSSSLFGSVKKRVLELSQGSTPSQDLERQFWMPDARAKQCYDCGTTFSTFRRRHHCRICGQVFCHACSFHMIDSKIYKTLTGTDSNSPVRCCKYCYRTTLKSDPSSNFASSFSNASTGSQTNSSTNPSFTARSLSRNDNEISILQDSSQSLQRMKSDNSNKEGSITPITRGRRDSLSWLGFGSNLARRFSSTASLGSFMNPLATPLQERKSRPQSSNSERFTVLDVDEDENIAGHSRDNTDMKLASDNNRVSGLTPFQNRRSRHNTGEIQNSSSFDNLYSLINRKIENKFDENKPKWVKELIEQSKLEDDQISYLAETASNDDILKNDSETIEDSEIDDNSTYISASSILNTSKISNENLLEIKSPEDGIVKFHKKTSQSLNDNNSKFKHLFDRTMNPEEFENFIEHNDIDLFARESIKQYFADERPSSSETLPTPHPNDNRTPSEQSITAPLTDDEMILNIFSHIYDEHLKNALKQMLIEQNISLDWLSVIHNISGTIANTVSLSHHYLLSNIDNYFFGIQDDSSLTDRSKNPTTRNIVNELGLKYFSPMDLRQRIKIKCIEGNFNKDESSIVQGLVFTKNVSNRKMRTKIDNPKILLFACSIGYDERKRTSENTKLTCMDLLRLQEANYSESLCTRIGTLKPDIIFVQGSVSGSIIERLHDFFDITVVLNVKKTVMERLSLFTGTQLIISPEIINSNRLGRCARFRVMECSNMGKNKSLMVVETDISNVGCSVLLKGTNKFEEFFKVKNILLEAIYWHYNARCEKAFNYSLNCLPFDTNNPETGQAWKSLKEIYQKFQKNSIENKESGSSKNSLNDCFLEDNQSNTNDNDSYATEFQDYSDSSNKNNENLISNLSNTISAKFQQFLDTVILSASPNVQFPLPFLVEKDIYFRSCLRPYFALNLVKSQKLCLALEQDCSGDVFIDENHPSDTKNDNHTKSKTSEDEDVDYVNFNYLSWITAERCSKFPQLKDIILAKAETKLSVLRAILKQRYMIQKPHPLLYGENVPLWKMERFSAPDFRACGPYLRCIPDIIATNHYKNNHIEASDDQNLFEPLSIGEHQEILVLFSVFAPKSKNAPNYCFKPRLIDIKYYGRNDMSLGAFLFRHFFFMRTRNTSVESTTGNLNSTINESDNFRKALCPNESCFEILLRHVMRFAHHRGTITIMLNRVQESQKQQNFSKKILSWSYCRKCQKGSKITEMSNDALALSFGKFLELKFYTKDALNLAVFEPEPSNCQCDLSIKREAYQFFNYDQLVVSLKYDPIVIYEVATPPSLIFISRKQFSTKKFLADSLQENTLNGHELFHRLEGEIDRIKSLIQNFGQTSSGITSSQSVNVLEQFNFDVQSDCSVLDEFSKALSEDKAKFNDDLKQVHVRVSEISIENTPLIELYRTQNAILKVKRFIIELWSNWNEKILEFLTNRKKIQDKSFNRVLKSILPGSGEPKNMDNLSIFDGPEENKINDKLSTSNCDLSTDPKVEDNKSQWSRSATISAGTSAGKLGAITSRVISKVTNKVTAQNDSEAKAQVSEVFTPLPHPFDTFSNSQSISNTTNFISTNAQNSISTERYLLPSNGDLTVVVRDNDLGSIIAYALKTQEYEQKLAKLQEDCSAVDGSIASKVTEEPSEEVNPHIGIDFQDGNAKFYCFTYFAAEFARLRSKLIADGGWSNRETARNVFVGSSIKVNNKETSFEKSSGSSSPPENVCSFGVSTKDSEELYIHSLANCIPWKAIGGKSGSTFSKTTNQRFILKEISKGELKHFVTFARDYIKYCEDTLYLKRPSTFVKIIGCYELAVSDSIHNILVMENLFYECNISFIYDLKGSMRNRKVDISNKLDKDSLNADNLSCSEKLTEKYNNSIEEYSQTTTVLMDENLRQISTLYPLYVHVHSKKLLLDTLESDSNFLKSKGIMDYSLLVGFDEQYSEYVVGIIDYVRLYDFTKELEFRVKKLGKTIDPTIVRPSHYQKRFLEAIQEYFIEVPDKWLKSGVNNIRSQA